MGQSQDGADERHDDCCLLLVLVLPSCLVCDSRESFASGWKVHQHCQDRDCLKQVSVNVKDQGHATTARQYNQLLHERIKHVYVNVNEQ